MRYDIYESPNGRHYAVVDDSIPQEEARCFIANKWKVAKAKLNIEYGWIDGADKLYFSRKRGTKRVWVITRMSSLPKSYLK